MRAHAQGRVLGTLLVERRDRVFVKVIGEHDSHIGKTRFVEHRTRHLGKPCEITRIYADALEFMTIAPELASDDDGVFHALLDIIGVHEQGAVVGHGPGIGSEGAELVGKRHHP